jgi:phage shock protein B
MSDNITAVLICAVVVLGPVWIIFHYAFKTRNSRQMNTADAAAFEDLSRTAARMESRMEVLERILDAEVPSWRSAAYVPPAQARR